MAAAVRMLVLSVVALAALQPAAAAEEYVQLAGHMPSWATAKSAVGPASPSAVVHARLHLGYRDGPAARALAESVSDPAGPAYGQYLKVHEFTERFAPSAAYVRQLAGWARQQGLRVAYEATNRKYVALEGTVAQFSAALRTSFAVHEVGGAHLRAPRSEPQLPASLAGGAAAPPLAFLGLDQGWVLDLARRRSLRPSQQAATPGSSAASKPHLKVKGCYFKSTTAFVGSSLGLGVCAYTPQQVRSAYGVPGRLTGAGQTVAIVDAYSSPFLQADLDAWSRIMGLPSVTVRQEYPPFDYAARERAPAGYDPGWAGEESLDVQAVHGIAPRAKIVYLGAASPEDSDLLSALNYVLEKGLASVVSNSYGGPLYGATGLDANESATVGVVNDLAVQAAVLGVGLYFSSGDAGDDSDYPYSDPTGVPSPEFYSCDPYVTAVGGTSLALNAQGRYVRETGWGDVECDPASQQCIPLMGGGGGVAYTFPTPWYQKGTAGVARVLASTGYASGRVSPDVAAIADPYTGYIVGYSQPKGSGLVTGTGFNNGTYIFQLNAYGGTSLACPTFAALVALKQQLRRRRFGFANPYFYAQPRLFRDVLPAASFLVGRDWSTGNNIYNAPDTSLRTAVGFDNVTGLGSPAPLFWSLP